METRIQDRGSHMGRYLCEAHWPSLEICEKESYLHECVCDWGPRMNVRLTQVKFYKVFQSVYM